MSIAIRGGGGWSQEAKLTALDCDSTDRFGISVGISGTSILVGAHEDSEVASNAGAAYLFTSNAGVWSQQVKLVNSTGQANEDFGFAVALDNGSGMVGAQFRDIPNAPTFTEGAGFVFGNLTDADCNNNGISDLCDIQNGTGFDCNGNNILDECEIDADPTLDLDENGKLDSCSPDCNGNGIPDEIDVFNDPNIDCNNNSIPDVCSGDCNGNGNPDDLDICNNTSTDCNLNGIPDECEFAITEDIVFVIDISGSINTPEFDLQIDGIVECLCGPNAIIPTDGSTSVAVVQFALGASNPIPLTVIDSPATAQSLCTQIQNLQNGPFSTNIAAGLNEARDVFVTQSTGQTRRLFLSTDANIFDPTSTEAACVILRTLSIPVKICTALVDDSTPCVPNGDSELLRNCANTPDAPNYVPGQPVGVFICVDTVADYFQLCTTCTKFDPQDCNENGILDECEFDCNCNGIPDDCDIANGTSIDSDGDGLPDECNGNCAGDITGAADVPDGAVSVTDLLLLLSDYGDCPDPPALCPADIFPTGNLDGIVGVHDLLLLLGQFGAVCQVCPSGEITVLGASAPPPCIWDCISMFPGNPQMQSKCIEVYLQTGDPCPGQ